MKILKSKIKNSKAYLTIEEEAEEINKAVEKAFQRLVRSAKVPGFRKGKVTQKIFEQYYGKQVLFDEAIKDVINDAYIKAINELDLQVIDYPKDLKFGELKEGAPFEFSCEVDIKPEVKLGKYKGIKIKKELVAVDEAKIEENFKRMQEHFAEYKPTEEDSEEGDIVRCNMEATLNSKIFEPWTKENIGVRLGMSDFGKGFDEQVIGLKTKDKKEFELKFEKDFAVVEVAGNEVSFKVEIAEVLKRSLPELTDEIVAKATKEQFKTINEYRDFLHKDLVARAKNEEDTKYQNKIIDEVTKNAKVDMQDILVEREIDYSLDNLENFLRRSGTDLNTYLQNIKKEKEDLRKEYREGAEQRVKTELVLDTIAAKEDLEANEQEIEEEVRAWYKGQVKNEKEFKQKLKQVDKKYVASIIKRKKAVTFLMENVKAI
jgi:trigger factor